MKVLVCFRDFSNDGKGIGQGTEARICEAIAWIETLPKSKKQKSTAVTVGGVSPHKQVSKSPVARLMQESLISYEWPGKIVIDESQTQWTTESELKQFFSLVSDTDDCVIVSGRHVKLRMFLLVYKLRGWKQARSYLYLGAKEEPATPFKLGLETSKIVYLLLPKLLQRSIYSWYVKYGLFIDRSH